MGVNYLIVISILEGRNFPLRHDKLLVVEAKFDGEVMSTDPVPHVVLPDFNTELAWEVDKKGLQMHRLQRTPIKLLWYAVDLELTRKETIGYMVLDIRLAQEKRRTAKWHPLLNSKYQKEKPEVLLSLFLEKEVSNDPVVENKNMVNKPRTNAEKGQAKKLCNNNTNQKPPSSLPRPFSPNSLKPVLISNTGYYHIGPPDHCKDHFTFSVTLAFAANLNKLIPNTNLKPSKGFYFYYSLFENEVLSECFADLSSPDFPAERASVRILSSVKVLSAFFEQYPTLEILLCCDDVSLGCGIIPLSLLTSVNKHNIDKEHLCIEGSVQLSSYDKSSKHPDDDLSPFIGVSVVLQKEKVIEVPKSAEQNTNVQRPVETSVKQIGNLPQGTMTFQRTSNSSETNKAAITTKEEKIGDEQNLETVATHQTTSIASSNPVCKNLNSHFSAAVDNAPRHFCFSLDLCNFHSTGIVHPVNMIIRYSYPFFGSASSILTQPAVEVLPKNEISIPQGFCAFNFATPFELLKRTFWETRLLLEVLHRVKQGGDPDQLIGTSKVNLFQVLEATPTPHVTDSKKQGNRRMSSCKLSVTSPEGHEVAEIFAVLTLDDFGPTTALCEKHLSKPTVATGNLFQGCNPTINFDAALSRQNGLTQEELLQAAMELEMWQERQRVLFRNQLKDKEVQHLKVLISEWKQRDTERELLLQRKLQECQKLEDKLRQTLKDAELKEKHLAAQEAELQRKLQESESQLENQKKEAKKQIENIKTEYTELLKIERQNVQEAIQKKTSLQRQVNEQEAEIHELKGIIESLKTQLSKQPDIQLKTEVSMLNMEKSELQQKLDVATVSKQKYKMQWGQAMRQISLMQQKLHAMEKIELSKKDEELAALQQRILVAEEQNALKKDQETLLKVKGRMDWLRTVLSQGNNGQPPPQTSVKTSNGPVISPPSDHLAAPCGQNINNNNNNNNTVKDHNIQQLIAQKEKLLGTGMYTSEDRIIKQLDLHIQKAKLSSTEM